MFKLRHIIIDYIMEWKMQLLKNTGDKKFENMYLLLKKKTTLCIQRLRYYLCSVKIKLLDGLLLQRFT